MINLELYKKDFKIASYDEIHKVSLIDDETKKVYILDDIAKEIGEIFEMDTPSSCDSLVINGDDIYLIEFKNRDYKNITSKDKREIRKKAYESRELLMSTFFKDKTIQYIFEHVYLFVVFKSMQNSSESFEKISQTFHTWANGNKPEIKCKLASFEGTFYKEIHTISKEDFETNYMPKVLKNS